MFEVLDEVCTPKKGSKYSACVDLFARKDMKIVSGETVLVPLGVKIDKHKFQFLPKVIKQVQWLESMMRKGNCNIKLNDVVMQEVDTFMNSHQLNLHIRSSMSAKHGLIIANGTGIIDLDYEGEIMICLHKPLKIYQVVDFDFTDMYQIKKGDKIAQINLVEHKTFLLGIESDEERTGGFGSTGK